MSIRTTILAAVSALTLSACAAAPADFTAKAAPVAASGAFLSADVSAVSPTALPDQWWRLYDDPVLDGLIDEAASANTDVRQAVARIERARAALRGARSDRLPQAGLSASGGYGQTSAAQTLPGANRTGGLFSIGADVSYELDLFGRVSGGVAAARGDLAAAQADADAVRIMVIADTTQAYATAANAAARINTARSIVALLDETLRLTRKRHDAGLADGLALARIEALREQRAATIPAIAGERSVPLEITMPIPVGDGAALLARRPDIRAAEQRLMANSA
ncbi:MAG TPA: TolC family protein, partial [Novosphingobium sp.]|nr:TolC family protein [Novosphingobium sp.]